MFKKLLVAVLALTMIIGLFSPALATKSPDAAKRLVNQNLPTLARQSGGPINAANLGGPVNPMNAVPTPPGLVVQRPGAPCNNVTFAGAIASYGSDASGGAMKYVAAVCCTVKSWTMTFYTGSVIPANAGITVTLWNDNGLGLPGTVISTVNVPGASIAYYPTATTVTIPNWVLPVGTFHVGYMVNDLTDFYRPLMDGGGNGDHSSYYNPSYNWLTNTAAYGLDRNWAMSMNVCLCGTVTPTNCASHYYGNGMVYYWSLTDHLPMAMRFSVATQCTLKSVNMKVYANAGTTPVNAGVDVSVYSNVGGLPGVLLYTTHVAHSAITMANWTTVTMPNIVLNSDYHIVWKGTDNVSDNYRLMCDDGLASVGRGTIYDGGMWQLTTVWDPGYDDSWALADSVCCSTAPPVCATESYYGTPTYYWPLPDAYGDDYFNMRFSNATKCTLKTVRLAFSSAGSVGNPGATVYLWKADPYGFPNLSQVITSVPILNVDDWYPAWEVVDLTSLGLPVFAGDYNVGYSTIINTVGDVLSIISDNGSTATGRSSEYYGGAFSSMADDWGLDVAFLIEVDRCCQPPGYCDIFSDPNDQWPVWGHDFARTSESGITLGDLCGIRNAWTYGVGGGETIYLSTPLIVDDKVYVFYTGRVVCLDLINNGNLLWTNTYSAQLGSIYGEALIEGNNLYIPTGSTSGILCVDKNTGALIWARGTSLGTPLSAGTGGWLQASPAVIIGNAIYFGDDGGGFYALDKVTGADLYYTLLLADPDDATQGYAYMMSSLSSDGTNLFIGTANNFVNPTAGAVYCLTPGVSAFTQNWVYKPPTAVGGGIISAPTLRCDNLFINGWIPQTPAPNYYCGFRQNLDPLTGIPKWSSTFYMGNAWVAPPATIGGYSPKVIFANAATQTGGYYQPNTRAVRAVNFSNSTVWIQRGTASVFDHHVHVHATTTQDPYVFYGLTDRGTWAGAWRVANGTTGAVLLNYDFTGWVNGTAIAHGSDGNDWIVMTTRFDNYADPGYTSGKVFAFRNMGPRPRMIVPESFVAFPSTSISEAAPVQRTHAEAIVNVGCATLNFTASLEAAMAPTAKFRSVSPFSKKNAEQLAASLVDYSVDDLNFSTRPAKEDRFAESMVQSSALFENRGGGEWMMPKKQVKPAAANSERLAPPTFVTWIAPGGGIGSVGYPNGTQDFTFQFDRTQMQLLGANTFYVDIVSDDPDFNVENPSATPQASIQYQIPYLYCDKDSGRMSFGTVGSEWWTNYGLLSDAAVEGGFDLGGAGAADPFAMFAGSNFFMTSMNSCAWNPVSGSGSWDPFVDGGFLFPYYVSGTDCGGCNINTLLPVEYTTDGGLTYPALNGDICTFAMIDSGQSMGISPYQTGPSMGILVKFREVGAYGPDFGNFKLVVLDVINRNATPITGLYCGSFIDWDVSAGDRQYGDADKGIVYQYGATIDAYGQIGIPSKGSYWPDGTKTDPMYNGRLIHSADEYWVDEQFDSLFSWHDGYPEGSMTQPTPVIAGTDKAYTVAFAKMDLGAFGQKTYGYAVFGVGGVVTSTDVDNLRGFVNKFAGFSRGDIDNNNVIDLRDLVRLQRFLHSGGPGPAPFKHLGDVNNDGLVNDGDCAYLAAYFFTGGTPPKSAFKF